MSPACSNNVGVKLLSWIVGFACIFVGAIELLFGAKCAPAQVGDGNESEARAACKRGGMAGPPPPHTLSPPPSLTPRTEPPPSRSPWASTGEFGPGLLVVVA